MSNDNKWSKPNNPPPPLFLGSKERDYVKQVNTEIIERIIGQTIIYYPIDIETTNYHPVYGEAIEKNFLPPVKVDALVLWSSSQTEMLENIALDKNTKIIVNFHRRRLTEDQDLYVREGDFIQFGDLLYEISILSEPRLLFGQVEHRFEISAICERSRESLFDAQ